MDNSFRPNGSDTQQPNGISGRLPIVDGLLKWPAGLIKLTEDEQKDAGIYIGDQRYM
jgi:hypothetical protein